jgi:hypothetical protein
MFIALNLLNLRIHRIKQTKMPEQTFSLCLPYYVISKSHPYFRRYLFADRRAKRRNLQDETDILFLICFRL